MSEVLNEADWPDDGVAWPDDSDDQESTLAATFGVTARPTVISDDVNPWDEDEQLPVSMSPFGLPGRASNPPKPTLKPLSDREAQIMECLKEVVDPELGVNVVDLGLVYGVTVSDANDVTIDMTLTTPACPLTDQIEWGAQAALADLAKSVTVNWVWLPPWTLDLITEDGREQLRYIGYNV